MMSKNFSKKKFSPLRGRHRREEILKVSRILYARLTVGRGVRQWQRAFQRDGRHCPRVKPGPRFSSRRDQYMYV